MSNLPARQQKKAQLVRTGYLGVGIGAVLFIIAILTTSWILGIFGLVVLGIAAWLTTIFRGA
jgi:predicted tellurium resistance membrane protein TerC